MDTNQKNLTQALSLLVDWFHRLGGAARYPGFCESDIPLCLALTLAEHLEITLSVRSDVIARRFNEAAAHVLPEVNEYIARIKASPEESHSLLASFVEYADARLKRAHREDSRAWVLVVESVRQLKAFPATEDGPARSPFLIDNREKRHRR